MKKILIITMAFLAVFAQTTRLKGAGQQGKQDSKTFVDDQSDDVKRLLFMTSEQKNKALFNAVESNDFREVNALLGAGAVVNITNRWGNTPLYYAVFEGNLKIMKILLAAGAVVKAADLSIAKDNRDTKIMKLLREKQFFDAIKSNDRAAFETLISLLTASVAVDLTDSFKRTPLHIASEKGNVEIVKSLLANGAKVDATDQSQQKPLHIAVDNGNPQIVEMLLAKGAEVNAVNDLEWTPLHFAANNGNIEVLRSLLAKGAEVNAINNLKNTPLHIAVDKGNPQTVKMLLANGAKVNATNNFLDTPLHFAPNNGNIEVLRSLLAKGAAVDAIDKSEWTPLHIAVEKGGAQIVKNLLLAGAAVDVIDQSQQTPLHIAQRNQNVEVARILRGKQLFDAIKSNDRAAYEALLNAGVELDFAYELAQQCGNQEIVRLIKREQFSDSIQKNKSKNFDDFIAAGGDIQSRDLRGLTPFHTAAKAGNAHAIQTLLDAGLDMHATDRFGNTPFGVAAYEMNVLLGNKNRTPEDKKRAETYQTILQMLIDAELKQATKEHNPYAVELLLRGHKYLHIKPIHKTIEQALALATSPQPFTDDQIVEGRESKDSVGCRRLNAQQKKERNEEVIRLLTKSIEKK